MLPQAVLRAFQIVPDVRGIEAVVSPVADKGKSLKHIFLIRHQ
jgi:hypothetical protein